MLSRLQMATECSALPPISINLSTRIALSKKIQILLFKMQDYALHIAELVNNSIVVAKGFY